MPSQINKWKIIWNLPGLLKKSLALFISPATPKNRKLILVLVGLGYFISPIDLIPDIIPIIGQIDDLGVIFLLLNWFVNLPAKSNDSIETDYYYVNDENKNKK